MRRTPLRTADDLGALEQLISSAPEPVILIFDADNTLVPQGVSVSEFVQGVTTAVERFERHPKVGRVVVLTNGPERGVAGMMHRGNKPWTSRRRLGLNRGEQNLWVVGDQVLTDGVLAWRLGATYVPLAIDVIDEAPRQATMRRVGKLVAAMCFERAAGG